MTKTVLLLSLCTFIGVSTSFSLDHSLHAALTRTAQYLNRLYTYHQREIADVPIIQIQATENSDRIMDKKSTTNGKITANRLEYSASGSNSTISKEKL